MSIAERIVTIENCGPVERIEIPLPEEGGVTVLRGAPGAGKTHTLSALSEMVGGEGRAVPRIGSGGFALEGLGLHMVVKQRRQRLGELEVVGLDGADPSILIDPRVKDPAARERARIAAMCRLARAKPALEEFAKLVGGMEQLTELCRLDTLQTSEIVELAARIKRDLEAKAREFEGHRDKARTAMQAQRATLEALEQPPAGLPPVSDAREAHEAALRELERAQGARDSAAKLIASCARARAALDSLGERGTEAAIAEAARRTAVAEDLCRRSAEARSKSEEALRQMEMDLVRARAALAESKQSERERLEAKERAEQAELAAHQDAEQRAELARAVAEGDGVDPVSEELLADLRRAANEARSVAEQAAQAQRVEERAALIRLELEALRGSANHHAERADSLRRAASGTEDVLTAACAAVCGDSIKVQEGRLMALHPRRGWIPFDELSTGEGYTFAIPMTAKSVRIAADERGMPALLVLNQESWQALGPDEQEIVRALAVENRVNIVTAAVDRGELRAEVA